MATLSQRRWLVPEVVQTSAMDCGPAALKALLEGFGVPVSYGRLREACQTDVDGTSIDTLEEVAGQLGLVAEQILLPLDHLLVRSARALPALVVVRLPGGDTHFVIVWSMHGNLVQVMDPARGRRWMSRARLLEEVYVHATLVAAEAFREWASSDDFLAPLRRRLARFGATRTGEPLLTAALAAPGWQAIATLDAAARLVQDVVDAGGVSRGSEASRLFASLVARALTDESLIPSGLYTARPAERSPEGLERVCVRGAVIVRARGRKDPAHAASAPGDSASESAPMLSPELVAALSEPSARSGRELWRLLRADGWLMPALLLAAFATAALVALVEALALRALFELDHDLALLEQRLAALAAWIALSAVALALEWPVAGALLGLGRRLEARLRIAFLTKLPRLEDRYFQSRPSSDMAERSHATHLIRQLPSLGGQLLRDAFELVFTCAGIVWLDPKSLWLALAATVSALAVPLAVQPLLSERDLRVRSHQGALGRFYLDALRGLVPIRTHGAERAVRREHEALLVHWARAAQGLARTAVATEAAQALVTYGLIVALVLSYVARADQPRGLLLLVYWALNLPALGQELVLLSRQYPSHRNTTLRLLEPLGAPEAQLEPPVDAFPPAGAHPSTKAASDTVETASGVAISLQGVSVVASGHAILGAVDLDLAAGAHVAIVGPSGAGKSSLAGVLLGWHRPAAGRILIDGEPLDARSLGRLRAQTAWVDPAVQLWNRSLLDNLRYASEREPDSYTPSLDAADLHALLESLPLGLQTPLGEGGALVSGGEGQRVRFGRALLRRGARLVILDEPFRGLDREQRRSLLARAGAWWKGATLLAITHDVGETLGFARVLVVDGGRIVEDGHPEQLAAHPGSRYRALLDAERRVQDLWRSRLWHRLRLEHGRLVIQSAPSARPATPRREVAES